MTGPGWSADRRAVPGAGRMDGLLGPGGGAWARRWAVATPLIAVVAWSLLRLIGIRLPLLPLILLLLVVGLLQRFTAASPDSVRLAVPYAPAPAVAQRPVNLANLVDATGMARWESRLIWLEGDRSAFVARAQPQIADLVDRRLWLRYGISRTGDPKRARKLLGEELWALLHEPLATAPTPRGLAAIVTRIEQL